MLSRCPMLSRVNVQGTEGSWGIIIMINRSILINIIDPRFFASSLIWQCNSQYAPPHVHHSTGIWTNRSSFVSWNEVPNAWLFWAWKIWARQVTSQRLRRFPMKKLVLVFVRRGFCDTRRFWNVISFQCDQDLSIILTSLRELEIQAPRNKIGTGTLKLQSLLIGCNQRR